MCVLFTNVFVYTYTHSIQLIMYSFNIPNYIVDEDCLLIKYIFIYIIIMSPIFVLHTLKIL